MATVADMVPSVRQALAVNAEYDAATIAPGIRRVMKRLLRDYNFPKSVKLAESAATLGSSSFDLPASYKRVLQVRWVEFAAGVAQSWSEPLGRRESFVMPSMVDSVRGQLNGVATHYWIAGSKLNVNNPAPASLTGDLRLQVYYQSMEVDAATEAWMLQDLEDIIFTYSMVRLAMELRKPEVMQTFAGILPQDLQSIAIYSNELEWEGVEMTMHQADNNRLQERYPR